MNSYENVSNIVKEILIKKYRIPAEKINNKENETSSLFSLAKIFTSHELVMLFFDLEKKFNLELDASLLIKDYDFSTINGIVSYIVNSKEGGDSYEEIG